MTILEAKELQFSYKSGDVELKIFDDFNFKVDRGDFAAIKGPSGSGKSTLLYLFAGLLGFDSGKILVNDRDISQLDDLQLAQLRNKSIGFVFQQFHLLPKASVLENILLPTIYPLEEKKPNEDVVARAKQIARDLGIEDRLHHYPNQLSGGQQQRVAIARALINDPEIILADEPTGNLDSKSTENIIEIFKKLHEQGKTIVLITHEEDVAQSAAMIFFLKDGKIVEKVKNDSCKTQVNTLAKSTRTDSEKNPLKTYAKILPLAVDNAFRHRTRSALTMLGIIVGVAAVCSMITLGQYTKKKILESYTELGVNTVMFSGYPNWDVKATDEFPTKFNFFDWDHEIVPLKKIFPDIMFISPNMRSWQASVAYGGKTIESEPQLMGVSEDGLSILGRNLIVGRGLSPFHIESKDAVCVIGYDIGTRLFSNVSPIGQIIHIFQDSSSFPCEVIGVLESKTSNNQWSKPNLQVVVPFTLFQAMSENWWRSQIREIAIQLRQGSSVEKFGKALRTFFELKYGKSGRFMVDSDSILLAQMKKFLNLFSILLAAIALVTLTVGGMGIANMMLVSVSERLKEIGLRKSVGATHASIRNQFLLESLVLCSFAGIIGLTVGIATYQGAIYGASRLIDKLQFKWVFEPTAIVMSLVSIVTVGLLSGLAPAIKAEKLQVIDALRSE